MSGEKAREFCKVYGCGRERVGQKDHCLPHHRQIVKFGQIISETISIRDKSRKCLVDGCDGALGGTHLRRSYV